ncbi:MAG: hypothetical protein Q9214_004142 [Letrouitia sp. 1 TL-2023]
MAALQEAPLDEIQWRSQPIAQSMGGIQTNTVLPYFSHSPFFDPTSNNATITTQASYNPELTYIIQTREAFEGRLKTMQGLEFIVAHDPSDEGKKAEHSGVWVIRKQHRRKKQGSEDEVVAVNSYFVVGENVYMAPSVGNILSGRLAFEAAAVLPSFTPAQGHFYAPTKPKTLASVVDSQGSKESTPMPGTQDSTSSKNLRSSSGMADPDAREAALLADSYNMMLRYGHEYMDETPLVGAESGSFIISKSRDVQPLTTETQAKAATTAMTAATTKPEVTKIDTEIPPQKRKDSKGVEKSPITPGTKDKKGRRKSKVSGNNTGN